MSISITKNKEGFTLVEVILYVAVVAFTVASLGFFLKESGEMRVRQQVSAEVEQQGILVSQRISQAIRNASSITSPSAGSLSTTLTLAYADALKNPTIFDLLSGVLRVTEGAESSVDLTNGHVIVSGLTFKNVSWASTPGSVHFEFTLTYDATVEAGARYQYAKTFYGAASLR